MRKSDPPSADRLVRLLTRTVTIGAIAWVGMTALQAVRTTALDTTTLRAPGQPAAALPASPVSFDLDGFWTLDGLPWQATVEMVAAENLPECLAATPPVGEIGTVPTHWANLLDRLKAISTRETLPTGFAQFRLETASLRISLLSSEAEDAIAAVRCAIPRGPDSWTLITAVPRVGNANTSKITIDKGNTEDAAQPPHLLPLDQGVRSLAARFGRDGTRQCELFRLSCAPERWFALLRDRQWTVDQPVWAEQSSCLTRCVSGGKTVHVRVCPVASSLACSSVESDRTWLALAIQ